VRRSSPCMRWSGWSRRVQSYTGPEQQRHVPAPGADQSRRDPNLCAERLQALHRDSVLVIPTAASAGDRREIKRRAMQRYRSQLRALPRPASRAPTTPWRRNGTGVRRSCHRRPMDSDSRDGPPAPATPPADARVAAVGTYPPRECGIGTFTRDLLHGLHTLPQPVAISAGAINGAEEHYDDDATVRRQMEESGRLICRVQTGIGNT